MNIHGINMEWLGHDSFKINTNNVIYIDPWKINKREKADLILITHGHYDHCSPEDVQKLMKEDTIIIATQDCASKLAGNIKTMQPGDSIEIKNVKIEAVPSYNIGKQFHPKENNWVGYVLTVSGKRIYHAGDTDNIPEMEKLENIDIALLPVSGTYVMTAEEAVGAAKIIKPKVAIPAHWGEIVGSIEDARKFKKFAEEFCEVVILNKV